MNYARQYPKFWLGYFFVCVFLFLVSAIETIVGIPKSADAGDILGLAFALLGMWPLYGYVRQRRYEPRWLWIGVFAVSALSIGGTAIACLLMLASGQSPLAIIVALALLGLGVPYLFALFQYAFRSAHLWQ